MLCAKSRPRDPVAPRAPHMQGLVSGCQRGTWRRRMNKVPPEVAEILQRASAREQDSAPRRHHYVPRFYLARFCDQRGQLAAYDRTTRKLISGRAERLGFERDLYRLPDNAGLPKYFLEEVFGELESQAASAIERVVQSGVVTEADRRTLATYLTLQILRTPHTIRAVTDMAAWSASIEMQIELGRKLDRGDLDVEQRRMAENALRQLEDGTLRIVPAEKSRVGLVLAAFEQMLVQVLRDWTWLVVLLDRPRLLTSDNPVVLLGEPDPGSPATNLGVATALEIWLPLDPRRALVLSRDQSLTSPLIGLSDAHVRSINLRLALESTRWIFFRPGTATVRDLQVPREAPRWFSRTMGRRDRPDGTVGELIQTGVSRPYVPNERLLSGRPLRPFPRVR